MGETLIIGNFSRHELILTPKGERKVHAKRPQGQGRSGSVEGKIGRDERATSSAI